MKTLFAYTCFNRPHYYRQFLDSLRTQNVKIDVAGFPDGARNQHEIGAVNENRDVTIQSPLEIHYFETPTNLGITRNCLRLFDWGFSQGYDVIVFSEDDMVLAPDYVETVLSLQQYAATFEGVGLVSAYGPLNQVKADQKPGQVAMLGHKWTFAINKALWGIFYERLHWFKTANLQQVNDWLKQIGYGHRNSIGYGLDHILDALHFEYRLAPLNASTKHARYIGAVGEHFNEALYTAHSMGGGEFYGQPVKEWKFVQSDIDFIRDFILRNGRG